LSQNDPFRQFYENQEVPKIVISLYTVEIATPPIDKSRVNIIVSWGHGAGTSLPKVYPPTID
jgi:hypothetical protein